MTKVPKAFISYSYDDPEHRAWVLGLATDLRINGVDATLDQWDLRPGQDTTLFMESQIRDANFVVLVCTPIYAQKSNIPLGGVGYEKNIISAELLQATDLKPKFIPVLRRGEYRTSLPTYLGSKYAVDFRRERNPREALDELLQALHEIPAQSKPPIGPKPSAGDAVAPVTGPAESDQQGVIEVSGNVDAWEKQAEGRFNFLRQTRIDPKHADPFVKGYWQASFALQGRIRDVSLPDLLVLLRNSKTGRTGWDIGWVPTREGIAPYPFQNGIEVWLAEDGGKEAGHSDFWRAQKTGTFSIFRGYQEDEDDFRKRYAGIEFDYTLALWRVAEFLLYVESFSRNLAVDPATALVRIRWSGLHSRRIGYHKSRFGSDNGICRQPEVSAGIYIPDTTKIRSTLVHDVTRLTRPLFETFDFFSKSEEDVRYLIKDLFDAEKEAD
jgi:hypothetical protein